MNLIKPVSNPFVFLIVTTTLLSACASPEDEVVEEPKKAVEQVTETVKEDLQESGVNESNVKWVVTPNPEIGKYDIEITWPEDIPKVYLKVNNNLKLYPEKNVYRGTFESSKRFEFYLEAVDYQANVYDRYTFVINTPNDLIISGKYNAYKMSDISFERIKILKSGTLYTGTDNFVITTNYLEVEEKALIAHRGLWNSSHISTLDTFTIYGGTYPHQPGKITINAKKIVGELLINSLGLDGMMGASVDDTPRPHNSTLDGKDAVYKTKIVVHIPPNIRNEYRSVLRRTQQLCRAELVANPEPGKPGANGIPGGNGVQGGDAPKFEINVEDYSEFKVYILSRPGEGGRGGSGGPGEPGGLGGYYLDHNNRCVASRTNKRAADGPAGQQINGQTAGDGAALGLSGNFPPSLMRSSVYFPSLL